MTSIATITSTVVTKNNQLEILVTKLNAALRSLCSNSWLIVGTNAAVNAPSPNNRRNRFGNVKADTKAELNALVPNTAAITISRTNPSTRDNTVAVAMTPMFFKFFDTTADGKTPAVYCAATSLSEVPLTTTSFSLYHASRNSSGNLPFENKCDISNGDTPGSKCKGHDPR